MAASIPGDEIFDWKLVSIVFTTYRIGISGLILNLNAIGLTYDVYQKFGKKILGDLGFTAVYK
mgnify:CR=1 FL=1